MSLTTILLLQLVLVLSPSSLPSSDSGEESLFSFFSFYESSPSQRSSFVDAGIMRKMKKKIKDKKCVPEIVAIKKTRIVPVAVPVKSIANEYHAPSAHPVVPDYKGDSYGGGHEGGYSHGYEQVKHADEGHEEDDDDHEIIEGEHADGEYNDVEEAEGYEVDDHDEYRRRSGTEFNSTLSIKTKVPEVKNDKTKSLDLSLVDLILRRKLKLNNNNINSHLFAFNHHHLQQQEIDPRNLEQEQQTQISRPPITLLSDQEL